MESTVASGKPASKTQAALVSVLVNALLITAKLIVGLLSGSVAILADAAHSFLDLSASVFAYLGIRAALKADALHFSSDLWASLAVLGGISLVAGLGLQAADPLAGILVAIIIGSTAVSAGRQTAQVLLDAMPDASTVRAIERILASDPQLHGYHALRARQSGKHVLLDVAVHVDGNLTLAQAHEVGHAVSERIRRELPVVSDAVIHVEPADDDAHG